MHRVGLLLLACSSVAACRIAEASPPPAVSITNGKPGAFTLEAKASVKLRVLASIEGLRDSKWVDVSTGFDLGAGYRLVARCDGPVRAPGAQPESACLELAIGDTLTPVPWSGMSCSSQCNSTCKKNTPLPVGDYRLVVTTCDLATTFRGPAFHLDGRPRD